MSNIKFSNNYAQKSPQSLVEVQQGKLIKQLGDFKIFDLILKLNEPDQHRVNGLTFMPVYSTGVIFSFLFLNEPFVSGL